MKRLHGLKDLLFDTVEDTTNLVEKTHATVARRAIELYAPIEPIATPARAVHAIHSASAAGVYATIRAVNRLVHGVANAGTEIAVTATPEIPAAPTTPLRSDAAGTLPWLIDHAEGVLNGFIGDKLKSRGNGLHLGMGLRHHGAPLAAERAALEQALPDATRKLCVFVHGLSCTEWAWSLYADRYYGDPTVNFGSLLASELGFTPLYVRYNSGLHVSENGRALSELLKEIVAQYPVPVEEIVLIGHSMGGLIARSAAHYGARDSAPWADRLRHVFCLASPHLGSPLEKAVNLLSGLLRSIPSAGTEVPAAVLDTRSAGIKDLRFGYTVDEEWLDRDPDAVLEDNRVDLELLDGVGYYFIAATISDDPRHPLGRLLGDLLVRLPSAAGYAPEPTRRIAFSSGRVFGGMHHFHLANHPDVYDVIKRCLEAAPAMPELPTG